MRYIGLDVHVSSTVWCLLDGTGEIVERGKTATTAPELVELVKRLSEHEGLTAGQEVGKMAYLVNDVLTAAGVRILSFNAHQLRMIASSRKKTDRRDSYWIAKALQTGMTPHPVYIPTGQVRRLRGLVSQRQALVVERRRWLSRARSQLQAAGHPVSRSRSVERMLEALLSQPEGLDEHLAQALERCQRMDRALGAELSALEKKMHDETSTIPEIARLTTIPAVGERVAMMIHAWVGDVRRFRSARELASYAGLVPSVWQSDKAHRTGGITKEGSPQLRSVLIQAGHVLLWKCQSEEAAPLRAIAQRIHTVRARRKIAVVAAARHILRIAFYVLRDGTSYDPARLRSPEVSVEAPAA